MRTELSVVLKILLADDHQLVREGLKLLIGQYGGTLEFIEAQDYGGLRAQMQQHANISVAVVDLHMPGADNGAALDALARSFPKIPLVVVSAFSSPDVVRKVLALPSVCAFVPKNGSAACMYLGIQAALAGHKIGEVTDATAEGSELSQSPQPALAPRLEAVRVLLREGKSNKLIAHELGLSEGTVKNYMSEIFKTLKVTNRTQAARFNEPSTF